jgi:hypothetical protein
LIEIGLLVLKNIFFNINMVFPIVAPTDHWGLWYEQTWIYIISESFDVNMSSFLAQWFWRKMFLNDPTLFLHFCDYLPFEKDLALCKILISLYPRMICTKLDWNWPDGSREDFFQYKLAQSCECKTNMIPILMHQGAYSQKVLRLRLNFVNTVVHLCFFSRSKLSIPACNKTSILTSGLVAFSWVYRRIEILIVDVRSFVNRYPDAHFDY